MRIKDFECCQDIIRKDLQQSLRKGDVTQCVKLIETFSEVTLRLNNIKSDQTIEGFLKELSSKYIGSSPKRGDVNEKLIVFYDQVGTTICLGLQYLRGILTAGYDVVYIYENYRKDISPLLLNEIKKLNIEYRLYGPSTPIYKNSIYSGKIISEYINSHNPGKIVVHPSPSDAIGPTVMYSLPHIEKFFIVPGDHHFYAGLHSADYLIEFRKFGINVSVNERNIEANKIYVLPYYPIIDELTDFQGFPIETKGKIVFASAGATYKFMGSDVIFQIWKYILSKDNTVVLFMGKPDKSISNFIKDNDFNNRFLLLGFRKDFVQCIKNADVLVNSYPVGGALVSQTAAYFEKPVIAYCEECEYLFQNITDIFGGVGKNERFTKTTIGEIEAMIDKLVDNISYRKELGNREKNDLQTEIRFNQTLERILCHQENTAINNVLGSYDKGFVLDKYLYQQNHWQPTVFVPLILQFGFSFFWKFRFMYRDILKTPLYVSKFLFLYGLKLLKLK